MSADRLFDPDDPTPPILPARPHRTQRKAAARVALTVGTARRRVLEYLVASLDGATDDEVAAGMRRSQNTTRPRRNELMRAGYVADSGATRPSDDGNPAIVWTVTAEGLEALVAAKRASGR